MDWNDPDELRRLRDLLARRPAAGDDDRGRRAARSPTPSRCSSGGSGCPTSAASYFTFSNENNDLIWGFLAECHRRGWIYKGHDSMPWCARCGTGPVADGDERGLPGPRGPRPDGPVPARRPARASRCSSGRRRRGRWPRTSPRRSARTSRYVRVRQGDDELLARQGHAQDRRSSARSRSLEERPGPRAGRLALRAARSTTLPAVRRPSPRASADAPTGRTSTGSCPGPRSARTRGPASSTSRPAAAPRTSSSARRSGCRSIGADRRGRPLLRGLRLADRPRRARRRRRDRRRPRARGPSSTASSRTATATRTAGAAGRRCCSGSSTSGSSRWARSTTSRARR